MTSAQKKLSWPCEKTSGMFQPQSCVSAHPAAKPPAVTKLACIRLTWPVMPVSTTKDKKMTAIARLCAITVWS